MAFKLTKAQMKMRDELLDALQEHERTVQLAIDEFNGILDRAFINVQDAIEKYNDTITDVVALKDEVLADASEQYEEKSEKWQEGERGQEVLEWINEWESFDLDEVEVEKPDEVEVDLTAFDTLDALPIGVGE